MSFIYEVETRFSFNNQEEIYRKFPFLNSCFDKNIIWETTHYGKELHKKDIVLRLSNSEINNKKIYSLGYKEPDFGEVLNIRKEYTEIVNDGVQNSKILNILNGNITLDNFIQVEEELVRLGYEPFMSFAGTSYIGAYKPLNMDFKMMFCDSLKYPLLLEVEKEACNEKEIRSCKKEIFDFIDKYNLRSKLIGKEPPTLLYEYLDL
ncbi:MAG: hypothetical protein ACOCQW_03940 [Halanaerobiaceae bacterium]